MTTATESELEEEFARLVPDPKLRAKIRDICLRLCRIELSRMAGATVTAKKSKASAANFAAARAKQMSPEYAEWRKERARKAVAAKAAKRQARLKQPPEERSAEKK